MRRKGPFERWARIGITAVAVGCLAMTGPVARATEFSYSGDEGPGFWGELDPAWEACSLDLRQSPIDIEKAAEKKEPSLEPLDLDSHDTTIHLINKGHTIEQEYEEGSTLTFEGVVYELLQFHFHTLSEHTRNGERGLMELHAVFKNDDTGNLAVIGQIYELGQPNQFLAVFDQTLPSHEGDEVILPTEINLEDGFENTKNYFTYPGSLTTPPCSPIVTWIVLKKWATMSEAQFPGSTTSWATISALCRI